MANEIRTSRFTVSDDQSGRRLDRVLRGLYPDVPLGAIMKAVRTGAVRVDGRKAAGDTRLGSGSEIVTPWGGEERAAPVAKKNKTRFEIDVIYKDEDVLVGDKPAGMLSQPDSSGDASFVEAVWAALSWSRNDFRPAVVGRLDRGVSGVLVAALNASTLRTLNGLFSERKVRKIYRAVTDGDISGSGVFDAPIAKDGERNISRIDAKGQRAITKYRVIGGEGRWRLVELELITGRPHQARVHMASAGYPIAGDVKYGGTKCGVARVFLHAYSLTLPNDDRLSPALRGARFETPDRLLEVLARK